MNETVKSPASPSISQQVQPTQQSRIEISSNVQAEFATLNVRYRDMQETMSRLISMLAAENAELKNENTTLKKQIAVLQTQTVTET